MGHVIHKRSRVPPHDASQPVGKLVERRTLAAGERLKTFRCSLLNFADIGRPNPKLTGESTLRGMRTPVKAGLPNQELDNAAFPVRA